MMYYPSNIQKSILPSHTEYLDCITRMNFVNITRDILVHQFQDKSLESTKGIKDLFYVCESVPNEWILEIRQKFEA